MSTRRLFPNDPPRITFTRDFERHVHGDLLPGRTVTIVYDAERLPNERSRKDGQKAWTIRCFYKFVEQSEPSAIDMWSETGEILTKITNETGEGTMMLCRIPIPQDADHLTLWFLNTGISGAEYWDSNFGRNYVLRFIVEDLDIAFVGVEHDPKIPLSRFRIEVLASPDADNLAVLYRILNDASAPKDEDTRLELRLEGPPDSSGKRRWSGSTAVPEGAVVRFTLAYDSYGNAHADTNNGKGYVTWAGAKPNREAAVVSGRG